MERGQFTFYRSYWEALMSLPKKDRLAAFEAICAYALDGLTPCLTGAASTAFILIRPTLDTGKKRAESGRQGGAKQSTSGTEANAKQNESKTEAKPKQTASEKEREKEGEKEKERENDSFLPIVPLKGDVTPRGFEEWWQAYPKKVGKADAMRSYARALKNVTPEDMLTALEAQKRCVQWTREGGRFVPNPATWLNQGRWDDEPAQETPSSQKRSVVTQEERDRIQRFLAGGAE